LFKTVITSLHSCGRTVKETKKNKKRQTKKKEPLLPYYGHCSPG
jgi:hypothetical protein